MAAEQTPTPPADEVRVIFDRLRHDPEHHLGMGDVRLTMAQQDEIIAALDAARKARPAGAQSDQRETIIEIARAIDEGDEEGQGEPEQLAPRILAKIRELGWLPPSEAEALRAERDKACRECTWIQLSECAALADIREAVGDPNGKLMQSDLVARVRTIVADLAAATKRAEEAERDRDAWRKKEAETYDRYAKLTHSATALMADRDALAVKLAEAERERDRFCRLNEAEVVHRVEVQEAMAKALHATGIRAPIQPLPKAIGYLAEAHGAVTAERDRLRGEVGRLGADHYALFHAVWHMLDDAMEADAHGDVMIDREHFEKLNALVPDDDHPEDPAALAQPPAPAETDAKETT